jgi:CRISPR-associated protein Cas5d
MSGTVHRLETWGDFACFSRPDVGKVERWSYPCPTPSAVRGIFDAIYVKPSEFRWQVTRVELLSPPEYVPLRRNEVKDRMSVNDVRKWMSGKEEPEPLWADGDKDLLGTDMKGRTQRQTMALRQVAYRLHARIVPWPGFESQQAAFDEQFVRRASQGKCFQQPYFGCREFPAYFELQDSSEALTSPILLDRDLGLMLYDVFDLSRPGGSEDKPYITLFRASVQRGVLEVPPFESDAVLKPPRAEAPAPHKKKRRAQ